MGCLICNRIAQIQENTNQHFVAELDTGYVVLGDYQFFRGYSLSLSKTHVAELHDLRDSVRERFLIEMSLVAKAVYQVVSPVKLNYECLGNSESHLHWHIFPRHETDPSPGTSSWLVDRATRYNEKYKLSEDKLIEMKCALLSALENTQGISIHSSWKSGVQQ